MHDAASFDAECSKAASYDSEVMTIRSNAIRPRMPIFSPRIEIKISRWGSDTEFALWPSYLPSCNLLLVMRDAYVGNAHLSSTALVWYDSIFQLGNTLRIMPSFITYLNTEICIILLVFNCDI